MSKPEWKGNPGEGGVQVGRRNLGYHLAGLLLLSLSFTFSVTPFHFLCHPLHSFPSLFPFTLSLHSFSSFTLSLHSFPSLFPFTPSLHSSPHPSLFPFALSLPRPFSFNKGKKIESKGEFQDEFYAKQCALPRSREGERERERIQVRFQRSTPPHQEIIRLFRRRNWVVYMYSGTLYTPSPVIWRRYYALAPVELANAGAVE